MEDRNKKGRQHQQKITHCPQGHPYSGRNLYISTKGHRACIECNKASNKKWQTNKKGKNDGKITKSV